MKSFKHFNFALTVTNTSSQLRIDRLTSLWNHMFEFFHAHAKRMVWRKTSPLTRQLLDIANVVQQSAERLHAERSETTRSFGQLDPSGDRSQARP